MDPMMNSVAMMLVSLTLAGGLFRFVQVRFFSMGTKREIITALSVSGVAAILLLILLFVR